MNRAVSRPSAKPVQALRTIALCCTLAFAGTGAAQMSSDEPDSPISGGYAGAGPSLQPSRGQPMYVRPAHRPSAYAGAAYGEVPGRQNARSLFAVTLGGLIAQGLGSGISAGLSEGLRGSIVRWFGGDGSDRRDASYPAPLREGSFARTGTDGAPLHVGLAYEVHRLERNGTSRAVDPDRHVFNTGDRFVVHYRPALPGRVSVVNVNGERVSSRIDDAEVAAGELAALGPYEFVGKEGDEVLQIVLAPCATPEMMRTTRSMIKVGGEAAKTAAPLADCSAPGPTKAAMRTRSIQRVGFEGPTAFALDQVSSEERASGRLAPRQVTIRFKHRLPGSSEPRPEPIWTASVAP
jgi:hypothetical protein